MELLSRPYARWSISYVLRCLREIFKFVSLFLDKFVFRIVADLGDRVPQHAPHVSHGPEFSRFHAVFQKYFYQIMFWLLFSRVGSLPSKNHGFANKAAKNSEKILLNKFPDICS